MSKNHNLDCTQNIQLSYLEMYVLIPTHGRAPLLGRTLSSLAECVLPGGYVETVVVENGPKCGAESIVAAAEAGLRVRYMHIAEANKSNALNEAIKSLPEDAFIVFFDDDVRFAPDALAAYAEAAEVEGRGHYFGGPVEVDYEARPPDYIRKLLPPSAKGWKLKRREDLDRVILLGANWAAFASDLVRVGGFDVNLGPGLASVGQESEMQWRLRQHGVRAAYVEAACIWHYVPKERCSVEWLYERARRLGTSRGRLRRQEGGIRLKSIGSVTVHFARAVGQRLLYAGKPLERRLASELDLIEQSANLKGYFGG